MNRRTLSSSEAAEIMPLLNAFLDVDMLKKLVKRGVETMEVGKATLIILGRFFFVMTAGVVIPALTDLNTELLNKLSSVWVDRGAIPKVVSGADVMRPGIKRFDSFRKGEAVVVRDETYSKILAVGIALTSSDEAAAATHGKIVKNLHHVDDKVWKTIKMVLG